MEIYLASSHLWHFVRSKLIKQTPTALLTVLTCRGSTPAKAGAQMALSIDKDIFGTIGGGTIEHLLFKETLDLLKHSRQAIHHRRMDSNKIGMLCGGSQDIAIVIFNQQSLMMVDQVLACLRHKQNGTLTINANEILFKQHELKQRYHFQNQKNWCFQKYIDELARVFIIGGGHVSLALSQVLKQLDCHITVIDNRSDLKLLKNNPYTDSKQFITNYQDVGDYIPESSQHYVIIMTHSHHTDQQVLEVLINKKFAYLGMMGSKNKIDTLFSRLRDKGISEQLLKLVYAPIGMKIPCQTPQEIAISIAAQIIECKNTVKPVSHI